MNFNELRAHMEVRAKMGLPCDKDWFWGLDNETKAVAWQRFVPRRDEWRDTSRLHPILQAWKDKRVEVKWLDEGRVERFHVGQSTGWRPVTLRLHNCASSGGDPINSDNRCAVLHWIPTALEKRDRRRW